MSSIIRIPPEPRRRREPEAPASQVRANPRDVADWHYAQGRVKRAYWADEEAVSRFIGWQMEWESLLDQPRVPRNDLDWVWSNRKRADEQYDRAHEAYLAARAEERQAFARVLEAVAGGRVEGEQRASYAA